MNERRFLAGMALVAGVVLLNAPLNAAVESDVVGYTTMTMEAGKWYQVGCPFVALEDGETPLLNDVFAVGFQDGDIINIFSQETNGYVTYTWKNSGTENAGWCTSRGNTPVTAELPLGQAVFINKAMTSDVQVAGKVTEGVKVTFGSPEGETWSQITCVYPKNAKLNGLKWEGMADGDVLNIFSPDTNGYTTYTWKNSGTDQAGWCTSRGKTPVDVDVAVGQGFFVNKHSAGEASCSYAE